LPQTFGSILARKDETSLTVFRNGAAITGSCPGTTQAISDPCVSNRVRFPSGDVELTVLSLHASA
jgi:hypothetical protein